MNLPDRYQQTLEKRAEKPRTKQQLLMDEVFDFIGADNLKLPPRARLTHSRLARIIQENGQKCIREILGEMRDKARDRRAIPIRNKVSYFFKLTRVHATQLETKT